MPESLQGGIYTVHCHWDTWSYSRNYYNHTTPYLVSPHLTSSPRPSPSVFAYCKWSKTAWK